MSGLGNPEGGQRTFVKFINDRDNGEVHFSPMVKTPEGWRPDPEKKFKFLSGIFKSLDFEEKERTVNNKTVKYVEMQLNVFAGGVNYILSGSMGMSALRSLALSLVGQEKIGTLHLSAALSNGYPAIYAKAKDGKDEPFFKWALPLDEQKKFVSEMINPETGEVEKRIYTKLINKIVEMSKDLKADEANALDMIAEEPVQSAPFEEEDDDDMPF